MATATEYTVPVVVHSVEAPLADIDAFVVEVRKKGTTEILRTVERDPVVHQTHLEMESVQFREGLKKDVYYEWRICTRKGQDKSVFVDWAEEQVGDTTAPPMPGPSPTVYDNSVEFEDTGYTAPEDLKEFEWQVVISETQNPSQPTDGVIDEKTEIPKLRIPAQSGKWVRVWCRAVDRSGNRSTWDNSQARIAHPNVNVNLLTGDAKPEHVSDMKTTYLYLQKESLASMGLAPGDTISFGAQCKVASGIIARVVIDEYNASDVLVKNNESGNFSSTTYDDIKLENLRLAATTETISVYIEKQVGPDDVWVKEAILNQGAEALPFVEPALLATRATVISSAQVFM